MPQPMPRSEPLRTLARAFAKDLIARHQHVARSNNWFYMPVPDTIIDPADGPVFSIYLRKSHYKGFPSLELANLGIAPQFRGRGIFTAFLETIEEHSPYTIYIENALNQRLAEFFRRRPHYVALVPGPSFVWPLPTPAACALRNTINTQRAAHGLPPLPPPYTRSPV